MDNKTQERIKADAEAYANGVGDFSRKMGALYGYIAGTTAEHAHMQPVIDAAEKVAKLFSHKDGNCAICELARAIEHWKGKEVEPVNDKCRCIQPNWNAFTGKCLTCGKP